MEATGLRRRGGLMRLSELLNSKAVNLRLAARTKKKLVEKDHLLSVREEIPS